MEMAHQANGVTQNQVSDCIKDLKFATHRIDALELEVRNIKQYASELEDYYILLDTTIRNHHILLTGVAEGSDEMVNLVAFRILEICFNELKLSDIDYAYGIGFNPMQAMGGRRKANRPILIKLMREDHRRTILKNRKALKDSDLYSNVYINDDLPQVMNERRADIRAVYINAINKGQNATMGASKITVNNVTYKHNELNNLPEGLCLSDSKIMQVKGGLAFASAHAYLSNLHRCSFRINGQLFDSNEKAYQFSRAMHLKAPEVAQKVLSAKTSKDCKKESYFVESNADWDNTKRAIMKMIVQEKFSQNTDLKDKLLRTGTVLLVEGTIDSYWGAGVTFGSKTPKDGKWTGRNEMGAILHEVCEDLRRTENWQAVTPATNQGISPRPKPPQPTQTTISQSSIASNGVAASISFVPPEQVDQVNIET